MITALRSFFTPPIYENIERTQKARFLHIALFVSAITCAVLGYQNRSGATDLDTYLYILAAICLVAIPFNQRGFYLPVAIFISALLLVMITFSLVAGVGLRDAGLIAYPIFILFGSYLFSKEAVLYTTLLSIISITIVFFIFHSGYVSPAQYSDENQLYVILVLLPAAGFLLWVVVENWERSLADLKETYDRTLSGWGQTLELRDRETQGHSQRAVDLTLALAKRMGIRENHYDDIRRGALMHDIGKLAIPDAILFKKGRLTAREWEIVKKHPLDAGKMLEGIPFLEPALEIPVNHHEHWDGTGYPRGLSGEDIPLSARIFAVVDVWDALLSDRPYRKAWPRTKALSFIREQSGKWFDPRVVDAFLEYISISS